MRLHEYSLLKFFVLCSLTRRNILRSVNILSFSNMIHQSNFIDKFFPCSGLTSLILSSLIWEFIGEGPNLCGQSFGPGAKNIARFPKLLYKDHDSLYLSRRLKELSIRMELIFWIKEVKRTSQYSIIRFLAIFFAPSTRSSLMDIFASRFAPSHCLLIPSSVLSRSLYPY